MFYCRIRILCFIVALMIILSFIACSQNSEEPHETNETSAKTTTTENTNSVTTTPKQTTNVTTEETTLKVEDNPFDEFYEITWLCNISDDKYVEGAWDERLLEEKYNVDFKIWNISNYDREGLSMMLAAGDMPDVGYICTAPLNPVQLYDQGFTRVVPLDMFKKHFPYYYKLMEKFAPSSYEYNNKRDEAGNLTEDYYGISFINWYFRWYYNVPLIRLDWLENIGYEIPDSELLPISLTDEKLGKYSNQLFVTNNVFPFEDMNDIFRAFTQDDPDGNGEDDTYGGVIFDPSFRSAWVDLYWGQFGVISSDGNFLYKDETTGEVVPWYAYTGYKDYLAWSTDMLQKGYLRTLPEGAESKAPQGSWYDNLLANWMTGKIGFFYADMMYLGRPDFPEYSDRQPPQSIWLNTDEKATFVSFPVLSGPGPEGTWGSKRYAMEAFSDGIWNTYTIGANVSDGKLARVLTMWNDRYTNADNEFWENILYGIEGVHYKWSGEPWASGMITTPPDKVPEKYRRYGSFGGSFSSDPPRTWNEALSQYMKFYFENNWAERFTIEPYKYINIKTMGSEMYEDYNEAWADVSEDINTIISEFRNRVWEGQIANIDAEWEQYIEQLYGAGLEELINDYFNNEDFEIFVRPDLSF